jgi:hypothetical protein
MSALKEVFGDKVISSGLKPACFSDQSPHNFYLWVIVKQKVCRLNLHIIEELKEKLMR